MVNQAKILLVGCGKMGGAMLSGWLARGVSSDDILVVCPTGCEQNNIAVVDNYTEIPTSFQPDIIVFAVKPQLIDEVVPLYKKYVADGVVFLSVAAGKTIATFEELLSSDAAIIRSMPNLPATISKAITVAVANDNVSADGREISQLLLESIGQVRWVDDENLMDAVTAISGSGPAYLFYFIEALTQAGEKLGLSPELAEDLAIYTIDGSANLAVGSQQSAQQLRESVTSPNGTTAAALEVLLADGKLLELLCDATLAAKNRSLELK